MTKYKSNERDGYAWLGKNRKLLHGKTKICIEKIKIKSKKRAYIFNLHEDVKKKYREQKDQKLIWKYQKVIIYFTE